jgi:putative glycosyltransferase (TIGR04372 family)
MLRKIKNSAVSYSNKIKNALGFKEKRLDGLFGQKDSTTVSDPVDQMLVEASAFADAFYKQPSIETLNKTMKSFEEILQMDPENWQGLHQYQNITSCAGLMQKCIELSKRCLLLKEKLKILNDLDNIGFSIIPAGITSAIGHMAHLDGIIKMKKLGWRRDETTILVSPQETTANQTLLKYYEEYFRVIKRREGVNLMQNFAQYADIGGAAIMSCGIPEMFTPAIRKACEEWDNQKRPPLFKIKENELLIGKECLRKMGVPEKARIVCLHIRESGLYNDQWSLRNSKIETYLSAINKLVEAGYWVIRMGDPAMQPIKGLPQVIDYAHSEFRSDWMDIFLCADCTFFVGTQSGLGHVPPIFGKPCLLVNWVTWGILPYMSKDRFICKRLRCNKSGRLLTAGEMIAAPLGYIQDDRHLSIYGVAAIDNSSEEISDAVQEMIRNVESPSDQLSLKQELFAKIEKEEGFYGYSSKICDCFLKRHKYLLSDNRKN